VIAAAIVCIIVAASCVYFVVDFSKDSDKDDLSDWDGSHIVGFEKFAYLGAATNSIDSSTPSNSFNASSDSDAFSSDVGYRLVGITGTGECEVIEFADGDGNNMKQDANLIRLVTDKMYSIVTFSTESSEYHNPSVNDHTLFHTIFYENDEGGKRGVYYVIDSLSNREGYYSFIIDNSNGNVYSVQTIVEEISQLLDTDCIECRMYSGSERVYAIIRDVTLSDMSESLLQFVFTDNELQLKTIMSKEQFSNFNGNKVGLADFIVDRYSNIICAQHNYINAAMWTTSISQSTKIMAADYSFTTMKAADPFFDESFTYVYQYGLNGIVYVKACANSELVYTAYLNEDCQFIKTEAELVIGAEPVGFANDVAVLIEKKPIIQYGFAYNAKILKFDSNSPWKYSVNTVDLGCSTAYYPAFPTAFNGTNVYYFNDNVLYDIDVDTLELTQIHTQNEIKSISFDDNVHQVKVTATLLSNMQTIEGYIDESKVGDEKLIFEPYELRYGNQTIICISPLNR